MPPPIEWVPREWELKVPFITTHSHVPRTITKNQQKETKLKIENNIIFRRTSGSRKRKSYIFTYYIKLGHRAHNRILKCKGSSRSNNNKIAKKERENGMNDALWKSSGWQRQGEGEEPECATIKTIYTHQSRWVRSERRAKRIGNCETSSKLTSDDVDEEHRVPECTHFYSFSRSIFFRFFVFLLVLLCVFWALSFQRQLLRCNITEKFSRFAAATTLIHLDVPNTHTQNTKEWIEELALADALAWVG